MKALIVVVAVAVLIIGQALGGYAATNQAASTTASATIGSVFNIGFYTGPAGVRSSTSLSFKTADGSAISGWYYNALATLGSNQAPNDNKSDIVLILKSNVHSAGHPYYLKIKKSTDALDNRIGYSVGVVFDAGGMTQPDGTISYPTGFSGSTGTGTNGWGTIPTVDTTVYTSGTKVYSIWGIGIPISFVLNADGIPSGSYSTTITYTMTAPV